jgi:hypothetical protein
MQAAWPQFIHSNQQWQLGYQAGWLEAKERLAEGVKVHPLRQTLWLLYSARYAWAAWPLESWFDQAQSLIPVGDSSPTPIEAQVIWLEWQFYLLSGHVERVQKCFDHFADRADTVHHFPLQSNERIWRVIGLSTLAEMADRLRQPERAAVYKRRAVDAGQQVFPAPEEDIAAFEDALASLWMAQPGPSTADRLLALTQIIQDAPLGQASLDIKRQSRTSEAWMEHSLLFMALLRRLQEPELLQDVAEAAIACSLPHRHRWIYLPSLMLDGVVGLEADAAHDLLSWWLYADLPLGVQGLKLGRGEISLQAQPEQGAGAHILIHTSHSLTLEISTHERSYMEQLSPGEHRMLLTVLDRTDVRRET